MSPKNTNILTVQDWPDPKKGKLYKCIIKKVDTDKKSQCIHVAVENLNRIQLGRVHEISLPLPIRPSEYHKHALSSLHVESTPALMAKK